MSDKRIVFNNYIPNCPHCGAELNADDKFCSHCGQNLEDLNATYRDNESMIVDAIEDIDDAKKRLAYREKQFKSTSNKSVKSKILKWFLIGIVSWFVIFLTIGIILSIHDASVEQKIEQLKNDLREQPVDTIEIAIPNIESVEFVNTTRQGVAGYIQESEEFLKIPFVKDSFSNDSLFKGNIYLSKDEFIEVSDFDDYDTNIEYDNFTLTIRCDNSYYYEDAVDSLVIFDDQLNAVKRLDNMRVGDIIFECYLVENYYYMIATPYPECMIEIKIYDSKYDDVDLSIDDVFKVVCVDTSLEIG